MKRKLANTTVTLGLWLCLSGAAHAQLKDNIEINVFGGGSWYGSKKYEIGFPQSATPIPGKFQLNRTWRSGVRVGVYTRGHWGQEFFYSYEPSDARFTQLTAKGQSLSLPVRIHNYGVTALYYLDDNESRGVRPFLSVGVGGAIYHLTSKAQAFLRDPSRGNIPGVRINSNELTLNYGAGLKTRTSGWLGARFDVRGFFGGTPSFGLPKESNNPNAAVFPVSGGLFEGEASAGLVFYFFGKR